MCAEDEFVGEFVAGERDDGAVGLSIAGNGHLAEGALADEGVAVVVEIDVLVSRGKSTGSGQATNAPL